ncbi:MAG: hypothetical protein COV67_09170 [Nitrospinae bacterium CG11_big_fil_rev_8_21_14_0_20_56_8]|nr:MAG: hypothetical protein COV67_09170 [Nitrospinae bacterium CG11_big_fil_rev_8_21_14_0_20_56_8]
MVATFGACQSSFAENGHGYKRREGFMTGEKRIGESYVQLQAMLAPIRRSAKSLSTVKSPVTLIVTLKSFDDVHPFCKLTPRVNDALVVEWSRHPLTLSYLFDPEKITARIFRLDKTEEQRTIDARLIRVMNKAVTDKPIVDVLVIKGARGLGGGAISKLPFSSITGCIEVVREDKKKEKEEKPAHSSH